MLFHVENTELLILNIIRYRFVSYFAIVIGAITVWHLRLLNETWILSAMRIRTLKYRDGGISSNSKTAYSPYNFLYELKLRSLIFTLHDFSRGVCFNHSDPSTIGSPIKTDKLLKLPKLMFAEWCDQKSVISTAFSCISIPENCDWSLPIVLISYLLIWFLAYLWLLLEEIQLLEVSVLHVMMIYM